MTKVKIFYEQSEMFLEETLNKWLERMQSDPTFYLIDIKFQRYSAMIIYNK